jgi:hypothetical protein
MMMTCHYVNSVESNFEFKYLGEFETNFNNILGHESWAKVGLIDRKNRDRKSCATTPLKKKGVMVVKIDMS